MSILFYIGVYAKLVCRYQNLCLRIFRKHISWAEKLQNILEQVEGVGKVEVMITVSSMGKKTVEKDRTAQEESGGASGEETSTTRTEETAVYAKDGEENEVPFVTEETTPQIQGVLVAAQGGDNLVVAENITEAAEVLFGVEVHKIKIMKLN